MRGKNIAAGLLVSLISVGLAIGITFIIASSAGDVPLTVQTPNEKNEIFRPTGTDQPGIASIIINGTVLPTSSYNCTFPLATWQQFPSAWRIDNYRVGDKVYSNEEMLAALSKSNGDLWDRLLAQLFVTILNQQNGADVTSVRSSFSEAVSWLNRFPRGSNPTDGDVQQIEIAVNLLTRFNDGLFGPTACQYDLSMSTAVSGSTLAPGVTPSATATPTRARTRIPVIPTRTKEPSHTNPRPKPPKAPPATSVPPTSVSTLPPPATELPLPTLVVPPIPTTEPTTPPNTPEPPPSVGITPAPSATARPAGATPPPTMTAEQNATKTKKPKP
jgi:hypothetical protein